MQAKFIEVKLISLCYPFGYAENIEFLDWGKSSI